MNTLKRYLGIVSVFTILALIIGPASALDPAGSSGHDNGTFFMGAGFHGHAGNITREQTVNVTRQTEMLQSSLTNLGQQGVDISQPQADIAGGNISAAMQWLGSYRKTHRDTQFRGNSTSRQTGNITRQTQMLQSFVSKLEQQGVGIVELQSDIASGNIPAAMQWLKSYFQAHPDQMKKGSFPQKDTGLAFHNQTSKGRWPAGHSWAQNRTKNTGNPQ